MTEKVDIYQKVTNAIIAAIEAGQTGDKFQLPWTSFNVLPVNALTGHTYRGINIILLWSQQVQNGYKSSFWGTYKQWQEKGAQVRKGEKASCVVFWKQIELEPEEDCEDARKIAFAKWSGVFNAEQVDGYSITEPQKGEGETISEIEAFIQATKADIRLSPAKAFYKPSEDYIGMPHMSLFRGTATSSATETYYSTLFHELVHWTGAEHRLKREKGTRFGDAKYAFEEIVAELGAATLCASLGITSETRADHAQYIDSWLRALKSDKRFIFSAASQVQKAIDYLLSFQ